MSSLTFGSLFAGIGGIDLGLERAGWECRWQVEIDSFCCEILAEHWPQVKRYGDVREVDFSKVEQVALIAGGFPCQPVSSAGKQLAQSDPRWLWPFFARAIRIVRPRFVLVENVAGLLVWGFDDVLGDLASCGYDAEWQVLPAAAFGAPHIRQRVWLVAYADGWRRERQGHEPESETIIFGRGHTVAEMQESGGKHWAIEPDLVRVVDGFPGRLHRVRVLGQAAVPQIVEWIGRLIIIADRSVG